MMLPFIGLVVGANVVLWTEIVSRKPARRGYETGFFEAHPYVGVAVIVACVVVAAWVDVR